MFDKKIERCRKIKKKSSTNKLGENIPCGYSMSNICAFDVKRQT